MTYKVSKKLRNSQPVKLKLKGKSKIKVMLDSIKKENDGKIPTEFQAGEKKKKKIKNKLSNWKKAKLLKSNLKFLNELKKQKRQ